MLTLGASTTAGGTPLNHRCRLSGELPPLVLRDIKAQLSWYNEAAAVYACEANETKHGLTFPRGLRSRVESILRHYEVPYTVETTPVPVVTLADYERFPELRPYQQAAVATLDHQPWALLESPPRSGKTLMLAFDWVRRGCLPAVWICDTIILVEQAHSVFRNLCPTQAIGLVGDGRCEPGQLTVMTAQSAYLALKRAGKTNVTISRRGWYDAAEKETNRPEVLQLLEQAQMVYRDEAHHATQPMDGVILRNLPNANLRRFASGTPWHSESEGLRLEAVAGPVVWSVDYEYLFAHDYLIRPQVEIKKVKPKRFPARTRYAKVYSEYVVNNPDRNKEVRAWVLEKNRQGLSVCIIVKQIKHGEMLHEIIPGSQVLFGPHAREERKMVLDSLGRKAILCCISTVMGEGVDVPSLDCVVNAAGDKAAIPTMQRARCMTPDEGKTAAYMLDFADQAKWLNKHSLERVQHYRTCGFDVREVD